MMLQSPSVGETPVHERADRFKVGTLTYTKMGMVALFAWLLWGDLCFMLHDIAVQNVLPLAFKRHGGSNFLIGVLITTMPSFLNFTLNPIISTASDRTRTRWGRRIPYLVFSAPVNAGLLILLAFSEDIGLSLSHMGGWAPEATIVAVMAVCFALFRMTDLFVGTVYYYLFNDVVPTAFLARFLSLFRVVGILSGAAFNFFVFAHAETHMREVFLGAGILYLAGYTLMCFKVKEGEYPPPPPTMKMRSGLIGLTKVFLKECFFHRFYWYFFLSNAAWAATAACGPFVVFLNRDSLGLTLGQIGKIGAVTGVASAILLYPAGVLADRLHPLRFMCVTVVLQCIWGLTALNWLFWNPSSRTALIVIIGISVVSVPLSTMHTAAILPLAMRLLPTERFGQFCAASAMVSSLALMAGGAVSGGFIDLVKRLHHGSDFAYRYIPVWSLAFLCVSMIFLLLVHREWVKLGGLRSYEPPKQPGEVSGSTAEEMTPSA
jgi:maltose/moltooligosaccharide transporter